MGERILIVQTGFLGDVVLTTPVIENLAKLFPDAELSFLTTPAARELVCYHPRLAETLVFDKRGAQAGVSGLFTMAGELRSRGFSKVFSLHKSWRTAALLRAARIPIRYGFSEASARWLYSAVVPRRDLNHEVLRNLAILRHCGVDPAEAAASMHIEVPQSAEEQLQRLWDAGGSKPGIAIAPGSVWATKRWTVAGFTEVARGLLDRGYCVVLIGGPGDAEVAGHIERRLASADVCNLAGRASLIVSTAAVKSCKVLLTNDSAPMHVASAVGTPVASVWCATIPEFGYGPWGVPNRIHQVNGLSCRPCGRHGHQYCPAGTHACQLDIPAPLVLDSVMSLIELSDTNSLAAETAAHRS